MRMESKTFLSILLKYVIGIENSVKVSLGCQWWRFKGVAKTFGKDTYLSSFGRVLAQWESLQLFSALSKWSYALKWLVNTFTLSLSDPQDCSLLMFTFCSRLTCKQHPEVALKRKTKWIQKACEHMKTLKRNCKTTVTCLASDWILSPWRQRVNLTCPRPCHCRYLASILCLFLFFLIKTRKHRRGET